MKLLITYEDIKNVLAVDLVKDLGKQPSQVNRWIKRQQDTIINLIGQYHFQGILGVERLLENPRNLQVVKDAIIEHIDYLAQNNYVIPDKTMDRGISYPNWFVAPLARQMLENEGLLYSGSGRGGYYVRY